MSELIPSGGESPFDAIMDPDGRWSTRKLQALMGYARWENLMPAMQRAMASARNQGLDVTNNFLRSQENPSDRGGRPREDFRLTRHAAYVLAMNGDPNKPEVAAAQAYFAIKTREAEIRSAAPAPVQLSNRDLALMVIAEADRAEAAERKVAELEPSAHAWDALAEASGDYSLRDAAFVLNRDPNISTGQQRLMKLIRALGMVDRNGVPYAKHAAHLTERPVTYTHPHTGEATLAKPQIRVTVRGLRYLHGKLGGVAPLRFEQAPLDEAG